MHHKAIKHEVRKQLKKQYPNWNRLTKKEKKLLAHQVIDEIVGDYNFKKPVEAPINDLLGIDNQSYKQGIMSLDEMDSFIASRESGRLFSFQKIKPHKAIQDYELKQIDQLVDNDIINQILRYDGFTPAMREFFPSVFFRAELLKAIKFPEVSYRKFCGDDKRYKDHKQHSPYIGMECKQNRAFIGLSLNRKQMLSHVQMSQFRSSLTFAQMVNLTVYFLSQIRKSGLLGDHFIHCVDSTELPVDRHHLLASLEIKGKKIRIYDDIDCDCGSRRNKRDKSIYVVGYRMHTLTAVHPETGHSIPLISLLGAANHHDSHFLGPLVALGNAIGLDIKLVSADEAYHDKTGAVYNENGTYLVTPLNDRVKLPDNVDPETHAVTLDDLCEIPMEYIGIDECGHEFKCGAEPHECSRACLCPQYRHIGFDSGYFQRLLHNNEQVDKALELRKNCERPFNLLKKREGLEQVRVRGQHNILTRLTVTTIATLLIELVQTRKTDDNRNQQHRFKQQKLPIAA